MGFALYGKRRVGKTSILLEAKRRLSDSNYAVPVYFSMWELVENTIGEFAKKLTVAIFEEYNKKLHLKQKAINLLKLPVEGIKKLLEEVDLSIKIRQDLEFIFSFKKNEAEHGTLIETVFGLSERLAKETNTRCILMIDEFPSIIEIKEGSMIGEGIVKKIRTIYERMEHTVLCVSGSIRKTMEITVLSSTSAFYRQLILKEIRPLKEEDVKLLIDKDLKNISGDAIKHLYLFTKGIPFYVQFLGKRLEKEDTITSAHVEKAIEEFLDEEGNLIFREEFKALSPKEKSIVVALATNNITRLVEIAKIIGDSLNTTQKFLEYLQDKNIIIKQDKNYFLDDPIFEEWLRRRYGE